MAGGPTVGGAPSIATVLIVLDGVGDRPHPATGGVSPLIAAATPHLDHLCAVGRSGEVVVVGPGIAPESDAGVLALLGYDPVRDSPGRGVLEAMGAEVPLAPGDVAFRLNFATIDGDGTILDSRVGRSLSTAEAAELARALTEADLLGGTGIRAEVRPTVGHRGVLWLHPVRGGSLSANVSNSDPFYEKTGGLGQARQPARPVAETVRPLDTTPEAARTAESVNRFLERSERMLAGHRINARRAMGGQKVANSILLRNAGGLPTTTVPTFESKYRIRGASLTEMPVERGIARLLGLTDRYVGPMTGDRDEGYRERARVARQLLREFPFVYIHLKGPDEPGHDGDAVRKREIIEAIDRSFLGPFLDGLPLSTVRIGITADHATPCVLRAHSDDPVPFVLAGAGVSSEPGTLRPRFGASGGAGGSLGRLEGRRVVPLLLRPPPGLSSA